ncbi:hypothetical protein [Alloalcanivorax mobilis]|uniref:hypothetical protein n=1 Tax=Alloalcanivorax mobilis TaxID=2019569 RepID=UPI000B5B37FC|nr:hypothetical protein [Alloalcanivorax mobilis]ASK33000.1 hypothetical protein CEK62_00695 [Alcanivorax sp. N3-2A]ASK36818.1 hypothetical protein CEK62_20890 [Alcanivorax sp. N3-2A]|tara:strand:- start:20981 stop:21898 length:918 start_codon:yes stop_codon:yes gene_type:complete
MMSKKKNAMAMLAVACAMLSACGGDSSHSSADPDPEPQALVLSEANAARVAGDTLLFAQLLPESFYAMISAAGFLATGQNCLSGEASVQSDDLERPVSASMSDCVVENGVTVDGTLRFDYDSEDPDAPPSELNAESFTLISTYGDTDNSSETHFSFDGEIDFQVDENLENSDFQEVDGTLAFSLDSTYDGEQQSFQRQWILDDYRQIGVNQSGAYLAELSGDVTLGDPAGRVVLTTYAPVGANGLSSCPSAGDITAEGGDGTSLNLSVIDNDDILITLNGVGTHYSCEEYGAWLQEAMDFPNSPI